jgi:MFS family permease
MMPSLEFAGPPIVSSTSAAQYPRPAYAWYVVAILMLAYVFSFLDRQILNLLVTPIRRDLQISDSAISLLLGFAFALFYSVFALPLGRIVDAHRRTTLIMVGFATWSAFTVGCGLVGSYAQLLLMRAGVGVGEASLNPAAFSLITDYFPSHRRGRAQGIFHMGVYLGSGLSLILGGLITGMVFRRPAYTLPFVGIVRSWQVVFIVIGLGGLLAVPLIWSVREPSRRDDAPAAGGLSIVEVLAYFKANRRAYLCHNIGLAFLMFSSYGAAAWVPTYFIRHFHWTAARVGLVYGCLTAVCGCLGVLGGGWLADWMAVRGHRDAYLRAALWISILWFPTGIASLLAPTAFVAFLLFAPTIALASAAYSIGPASLMQMTPQRMRGQAGAVYLLIGSLIGQGIGPTAVAVCTDYVFGHDNLVGYSLLVVTCAAHALAAVLLWYGREPYVRTVQAATEWGATRAA